MRRKRAPHQRFEIERTAMTSAGPDAILDRILSPATWPTWQMEIVSTDGPVRVEEGSMVRGNASMLGFHVTGQSIAEEVTGSSFTEQVVVGVAMRIRYDVEEAEDGTRVTHRLTSDLPGGPVGRVLSLFLRRRLKVMQKVLLQRLTEPRARSAPPLP